jgi:hypothetical protein
MLPFTFGRFKMHVGNYLGLLDSSEQKLIDALIMVADHHGDEPDIYQTCQLLASWSQEALAALKPLIERYSEDKMRSQNA